MSQERDESAFMGHEPCPACGSRNNLARYASGRGYCHGCGRCEFPDDDGQPRQATPKDQDEPTQRRKSPSTPSSSPTELGVTACS
jgi:ribosomal protein L37AE/L43A